MLKKAINDPRAENQRKAKAFFERMAAKINGADERKAAAQAKRDRKNAKRERDAFNAACGAQLSRDYLDGKVYADLDAFARGTPELEGQLKGLLP